MPKPDSPEVKEAEKKVGAVLETLEEETQSDVNRIELEEVVDTNPHTGQPEVLKGVDIDVTPRQQRNWSR